MKTTIGMEALPEMSDDRKPQLAKGFLWGAAIMLPFWAVVLYLLFR